jgi:hypothetical protein
MTQGIRERASDALLRTGTELAFEQRDLERRIAAVSSGTRGRDGALQALWLARKVAAATVWLGWRIRPRRHSSHGQ